MCKKLNFHVFVALLMVSLCFGQTKKSIMGEFIQKYAKYDEANKLDSINLLINTYLSRDDLSQIEYQLVNYYKGIHYTRINRHADAIKIFKKSLSYTTSNEVSKNIKQVTNYLMADAYFSLKDYKSAEKYAKIANPYIKAIQYSNQYIDLHSILGYCYFINLDYESSLQEYQLARNEAAKSNRCKLAEINVKIAKIQNRKKEFFSAKKTIEFAIKISDSCNEPINKINALKTLREILIENRNFEEAQQTYDSIEKIASQNDQLARNKKIDSLETVFKTKIKEEQNKILKKSNLEKEQNIKTQKIALFATIFGILLLTVLLIYIFRISKQQQLTNKKLKRLNILNQKIFSVISHDFKGPITTLKLLLNNKNAIHDENSAISMYMNDIKNQLDQSDVMLDNLLEWAKNELLIDKVSKQNILIYDFVVANCADNKIKTEEKNITIENNIPQNVTIDFNESVLKIVFRNILNNAIKFSFEGSKIELNWINNTLEIVDYGKGIDEQKLKYLFKKNISPGLGTNMETGFGIGLYLSNELMEKNGGYIKVQKNDVGTTFLIGFK